jgi:hypothetical protein
MWNGKLYNFLNLIYHVSKLIKQDISNKNHNLSTRFLRKLSFGATCESTFQPTTAFFLVFTKFWACSLRGTRSLQIRMSTHGELKIKMHVVKFQKQDFTKSNESGLKGFRIDFLKYLQQVEFFDLTIGYRIHFLFETRSHAMIRGLGFIEL